MLDKYDLPVWVCGVSWRRWDWILSKGHLSRWYNTWRSWVAISIYVLQIWSPGKWWWAIFFSVEDDVSPEIKMIIIASAIIEVAEDNHFHLACEN